MWCSVEVGVDLTVSQRDSSTKKLGITKVVDLLKVNNKKKKKKKDFFVSKTKH